MNTTKKRVDWRTYHKGDLIYAKGIVRGGEWGMVPCFVYESQTQKNIVPLYGFGDFDEHSSAYLEDTFMAESVEKWLENCKDAGYDRDYVLKQMAYFKISLPNKI